MSSIGYCLTPKQAIVGIDDVMPQCPPPPRPSIQEVEELLAPTQELCDAPLGFFLAVPCSRCNANDRRVLFNCPPPPRLSIQEVELLVPAHELCDAPKGFFLAVPCNKCNANDRRVLFNRNNHIKLPPKKSSNQSRSNHIQLQPKGARTATANKHFEDTILSMDCPLARSA